MEEKRSESYEQIVTVEASEVSRQQALDVSPYCNFRQRGIRQKDDSLTQAVSAGSAERHLYQNKRAAILLALAMECTIFHIPERTRQYYAIVVDLLLHEGAISVGKKEIVPSINTVYASFQLPHFYKRECYRILPPGSSFVICLATETDRRQADFVGGGKDEFPKMELQRVPRDSNTDASTYLLDPGFRTPDSTRNQGERRLTSLVHAVDILSILGQKPKPNESQCGIFQCRH
ncbi:hypothetical protein ARMGADRAFT_1036831 [Armillaria gallica]|uniref:Uncharacterized protein n=1 Tax=Armillaria gallica TaxID=47427 RepID=A0A2H3CTY0_ARMGA|nr:hypothetical protein ARMGADRAFT_1036831 [Armillaria gallica]